MLRVWSSNVAYPVSMALPKKSPYFELLRYHTLKILEDGRLVIMKKKT